MFRSFGRLKALGRLRKRATKKLRRRSRLYGRRTAGFRNPQRAEYKCVDVTLDKVPVTLNANAPTNSRFLLVNGIIPGTGINNRIGRRIYMRSLYIRGTTFAVNSVLTPSYHIRMIALFDKQNNGASSAPDITEVLKEFNKSGSSATDYSTPINISNAARFSILLDKTFTCQNYSSENDTNLVRISNGVKPIRVYKKMNLFTQYNEGTAGTSADITSGALWLLFMLDLDATRGDNTIAEGNKPKLDLTVRLRYSD